MTEALAYLLLAQLQNYGKNPGDTKLLSSSGDGDVESRYSHALSGVVAFRCFQLHATGDLIEVLGCG